MYTLERTWTKESCVAVSRAATNSPNRRFSASSYLAYVRIRQDTSGYVRIRQDTSGYVSIRQHTPNRPVSASSYLVSGP